MKNYLTYGWGQIKRLMRDEQGAEGLEKLLIVAAIVLPLLLVLIFFRNQLSEWVQGTWQGMEDTAQTFDDPNN